ncbi:hypothetical protein ACFLZS_01350 [Patescibacteria group bacterium]
MIIPKEEVNLNLPDQIKVSFYDPEQLTKTQRIMIHSPFTPPRNLPTPRKIQPGEINYIREGDEANLMGKVEGKKIYFTLIYKKGSFLITELSFTDYEYLERVCVKFLKAIRDTKGFYNEPLITYKTPPLINQPINPTIIPIKADKIIHEWWFSTEEGKQRLLLLSRKESRGKIIDLESDLEL